MAFTFAALQNAALDLSEVKKKITHFIRR